MSFAWLILAHDAPRQLEALIARVLANDPHDVAVLHVDVRSPLWPAVPRALAARFGARLTVVEQPIAVRWGHRSIVEATARLIDAALMHDFATAHLLSGRDWPIADPQRLAAEVMQDRCYIEAIPGAQADRMTQWHFADAMQDRVGETSWRWRARRALESVSNIADTIALRRPCPYAPVWSKGAQWWSLPRAVLVELDDELRSSRAHRSLRFTQCADEHFIQTFVAARHRVADPRRYIDWSAGLASPKALGVADLGAIRASGAWIARKFDAERDPFFLELW